MSGMEDVGQVALTDAQQDQVTEQWQDIYDSACQQLSIAGFDPMWEKPAACEYPDITPAHYANIEGEAYTEIMSIVDYWFGRAKENLGWVEAELICREGELKDVVRGLKNALREEAKRIPKKTDRPSETEIKENAESYPYPRELTQRIVKLKSLQKVLDNRVEALERFAAGLSRQITLRQQEIDIHGRNQGRRHPGQFQR